MILKGTDSKKVHFHLKVVMVEEEVVEEEVVEEVVVVIVVVPA